MRSLAKLIVIVTLLAALLYGGTQAYLHHELKKGVEAAIKQAEPVAAITYRDLYVSPQLDGSIGVDGIVVRPKEINDTVKIESVRLIFPNIFQLLRTFIKRDEADLPQQLRLTISGVNIALNGALMSTFTKMQKQNATQKSNTPWAKLENFDALGCGDLEEIGFDELLHMGYQTLDFDLDLQYQYDKLRNTLKPSLVMRFKGMQSIDIKAVLNTPPIGGMKSFNDHFIHGNPEIPPIKEMKITYLDGGYEQARNRFCAARIDSTEQFYIAHNLEAVSEAVGATFPEKTMESYKKFLAGNSNFTVTMIPKPGVDLKTLDRYQLRDVIDLLDLKLTIDGDDVDFTKFEWGKSYAVPGSVGEGKKSSTAVELTAPKIQTPPQFRATPLTKLGDYVGSEVKIQTYSGTFREGMIESADNESVTIRLVSKKGKGFISFPIPFSDISSAKVFY